MIDLDIKGFSDNIPHELLMKAVSKKAMKTMNGKMKEWKVLSSSSCTLTHLAQTINPYLRGWINYYGR